MTIEARKAQRVQSILMGYPVVYLRHYMDGATPNMAQFTDPKTGKWFSIIWHEYAYGHDSPDEVEVMFDNDVERVLLDELGEWIEVRNA